MSALRSALDELSTEVLERSASDVLEADLVEIRRALDALESEFLRRVTEVERRRSFERHGYLSATSFLVDRCGLSGAAASERVRMSRALRHMPVARQALAEAELSYGQIRYLAQARDAQPDAFADHEATMVEAVAPLSLADTRRLIDHWRQAVLPDESTARMEAMTAGRRLFVSRTFAGMIRLDGWFDPIDGDTILTALAAATAEKDKARDDASPAQRRADGLAEICRQWLANGAPAMGGERPHIDVIVDLDTLEKRAGKRCETSRVGVIDPESARMLACDAGVARIITSGPSEPLDVGRRTRTIPSAIRRALVVRDGGCRFPGCDRPSHWCEGHHIQHWAEGGETKLDNLVLICRRHHRMVHHRGLEIDVNGAAVEIRAGP